MLKRILILTVLVIWLTHITIPFEDAYSAKPLIIFDKPAYNPFATVKILIVDPAANHNSEKNEVINAVVYTKANVGNTFEFTEVAPDAGVFGTLVRLTPDQNKWPGDLAVQSGDELFVQYNSESGSSMASIHIDFSTSLVMFDKVQYAIGDKARIFVLDSNANVVSNAIDTVEVAVWSTADVKGLKLTLKEINANIGIFTGTLSLAKDQPSSGNTLKVMDNDVITAKFTDAPPPNPAKAGSQAETKDLFAAALVGQKKALVEFKQPSGPQIVDQSGNPVADVHLGQVIAIQDNVVNNKDTSQKFAYIVLIKDRDGITVSLSWITGEVPPSNTFKAAQSWIPEEAGEFSISTFLWESIDNPVALAPEKTVTITVTHPFK